MVHVKVSKYELMWEIQLLQDNSAGINVIRVGSIEFSNAWHCAVEFSRVTASGKQLFLMLWYRWGFLSVPKYAGSCVATLIFFGQDVIVQWNHHRCGCQRVRSMTDALLWPCWCRCWKSMKISAFWMLRARLQPAQHTLFLQAVWSSLWSVTVRADLSGVYSTYRNAVA